MQALGLPFEGRDAFHARFPNSARRDNATGGAVSATRGELAFDLLSVAVDRVFNLERRVEEVAQAPADEGRRSHLSHQPVEGSVRARGSVGRKAPNLGQIDENRIAFETRVTGSVARSTSAGIFEFGMTSTKPLPNWSP